MAGKQAKILSDNQIRSLLIYAKRTRYPERNAIIVLLSVKAGMRAGEIAKLTWEMVLDPQGNVADAITVRDKIAKMGSGRRIPMHHQLRDALRKLLVRNEPSGPVVRSERNQAMTPLSIVNWFAKTYRALGLEGCSSHSGRRTFITRAARAVHRAGGSLRDVQLLAGHSSIEVTQRYIDGDTDAQRRLVSLI
ncbi:MAG: site-specific integrase [Xanthobacteraceae bacterium]|nr:site-specific integrase [Xanthobacteraceae bacterium]MCW5676614.1 site-specific integrase [Xanthobacteraceae bacterium]